MNIDQIKKEFPIFDEKIQNKPLVYLDSANSSQKPKSVIDRMSYFYENEFSNVGRSVHSLAVTATNRFEETRDLVKKFINAKHREEIIFTKGATEGINLVANSFGEKYINEGDEIILTELEHHSNYVPWHYLRNKKKAVIKFAKINEKKVCILGRAIKRSIEAAIDVGLIEKNYTFYGINEIEKFPKKNLLVICSGSQGEPNSSLTRIIDLLPLSVCISNFVTLPLDPRSIEFKSKTSSLIFIS